MRTILIMLFLALLTVLTVLIGSDRTEKFMDWCDQVLE